MAQTQNPRRFYIDHADNQPVVRAVPVRRPQPSAPEATSFESVATHQFTPAVTADSSPRSLKDKARLAPRNVSRLMRSARKRSLSSRG